MSLPLAGIRVLDLTHVVSGPYATSLLADFGADVIKIESAARPDPARRLGPSPPGRTGPEASAAFASLNRNKRSVAVNLKDPRGADLVRALAARSDVLTENFRAGVMERLGLGPQGLRARNPRLIYLSMSGLGQHGPRAHWLSYNVVLQALSGLMLVTGRPGDPPIMVSNSWADFVAGLHGALLVLAALARRRAAGEGTWIDMSQLEANVLPLGHLLLAAARSDLPAARWGNRSPTAVPQGVYRCAGEDAWCALSVERDDQWDALVRTIGDPVLADPALRSAAARRAREEAVDRRIEAWTRLRPARSVEQVFLDAGVPAAAVRSNVDVLQDLDRRTPGLRRIRHPVIGEMPVMPQAVHLDGRDVPPGTPAPLQGEHTAEVLQEILGVPGAEVARLRDAGVLV